MKKKNFGIVGGGVLLALTIFLWANSISVLTGNKSGLFNFLTIGTLEAGEIAVSIPSGFPTTGQKNITILTVTNNISFRKSAAVTVARTPG